MEYLVIDAFTDQPFGGNTASVVWLENAGAWDDGTLAQIAAEFKHSETAFVSVSASDADFDLRWFTPTVEVELCGHATLAAAHALWQWGRAKADEPIQFATRYSGILTCRREGERVAMDFPATPVHSCREPVEMAKALGVAGPVQCIGRTNMHLLLVLPDALQVRAAKPDMAALASWRGVGVILTAEGDEAGVDFVSRFFAPAVGIDEDPVTGSAHSTLTPYWAERLGKTTMRAVQVSARRGELEVSLMDGESGPRVRILGAAVTVMEGRLTIG
jgi:PhzF family phenazine biosynthesis protein